MVDAHDSSLHHPVMSASSDDQEPRPKPPPRANREMQRACDACRRRKVRCDGPSQPNHVCTTCLKGKIACTYVEHLVRHEPRRAYIRALEGRLRKTEALIRKMYPNIDLSLEVDNFDISDASADQSSKMMLPAMNNGGAVAVHNANSTKHTQATSQDEPPDLPSDDERVMVRLADCDQLPITCEDVKTYSDAEKRTVRVLQATYMGKSSSLGLIRRALEGKHGVEDWRMMENLTCWKRKEFWETPKYEFRDEKILHQPSPDAKLPPPDLLQKLIDAFFDGLNWFAPLLHKELFMMQVAAGLHETDTQFLGVVLLLCAVSSKMIAADDDRVLAEPGQIGSAGWQYFEMAEPMNRVHLSRTPRLFDLQMKILACAFLWQTSVPSSGWTMLGLATRMAQEVGAHRQKLYQDEPNLVDELWKRAFWLILAFDRSMGATFGRPCGIQDEAVDVSLPLEVDDDCWDTSHAGAKKNYPLKHPQPEGRPSYMAYFISSCNLRQIMTFAMRTIYTSNNAKKSLGFVGPGWEQQIYGELNTSLTRWAETVPEHLRWNPDEPNLQWFRQSASLWASYYHLRVFIHRPGIIRLVKKLASHHSKSATSPPNSLTSVQSSAESTSDPVIPVQLQPYVASRERAKAAVKAALACLGIAKTYLARVSVPGDPMLPFFSMASVLSSLVLLIAAWVEGANLSICEAQPTIEKSKKLISEAMCGVENALKILEMAEKSWHAAGKARDFLTELSSSKSRLLSSDYPELWPCLPLQPAQQGKSPSDYSPQETPESGDPSMQKPQSTGTTTLACGVSSSTSPDIVVPSTEPAKPREMQDQPNAASPATSSWNPQVNSAALEGLAFDFLALDPQYDMSSANFPSFGDFSMETGDMGADFFADPLQFFTLNDLNAYSVAAQNGQQSQPETDWDMSF
ncbi:fungal-specific transcription factor domain-containing protein [Auriculariales sp. MPI-PUGE-AT-0066]|nr:fungal-specific transcription factor domain-containing protein [Auriculariales sp. MPI-PUGE-AT-0066]